MAWQTAVRRQGFWGDETAAQFSGSMPFSDAPADEAGLAGDDFRFLGMADDTFSRTVGQDDLLA